MRILLDHRRYSLAFREPVRTAHGLWEQRDGVIVRTETADGGVGFGEIAPLPIFGTETLGQAETALSGLGGKLDPGVMAVLATTHPCTVGALRAATEMAAQFASAKQKEELVEARNDASLRVAALLPAGRKVLNSCEGLAERGFRIFKWKVGVEDASDEMGILDDLLAKLPTGSKLRLDANGAWDRITSERWLERCADRPIEHVEQPIAPTARGADDLLMGLANDYPTPIALDESLVLDRDIEKWLSADWPGVYVLKPMLMANLREHMAQFSERKAKLVFSSSLETGIGACVVLRAALEWTGEQRALGMGVWPLFRDSRFDGPSASAFFTSADIDFIKPEEIWSALN